MKLIKEKVIGECVRCFGKVWLAENSYKSFKVCEDCLRVVDGDSKVNLYVELVERGKDGISQKDAP